MIILKLGGSVITDKAKKHTFKQEVMDRLSSQLQKAKKDIILVHGAGSFGHITAKEYNLNEGYTDPGQLYGFALTHGSVQQLNTYVLSSLHNKNIPAVSLPPHTLLTLQNHKPLEMNYDVFTEYLHNGFTPVTFGDVVLDKKLRFSICSGDLLIQMLAKHFKPEKVIFLIDEDGVYTSNPKKDPHAEFIEKATTQDLTTLLTIPDKHVDVTKGMQGKIETIKAIAAFGITTYILNGNKDNRLYDTLIGNNTKHTVIYGEKK